MDAITKKLLNDFSKTQIGLQLPGVPAAQAGIQLGDLIAAGSNPVAADVAALGSLASVGNSGISAIGPLTQVEPALTDTSAALLTDTNTNLNLLQAKIDAITPDIASIANINARVTSLQAKIDAILAALKAAGLMS